MVDQPVDLGGVATPIVCGPGLIGTAYSVQLSKVAIP